jgi:uncharacterized membrane protein
MDGFGRWDLVVWIVAAYIAIMALVRMMLYSLKSARRQSRHDSGSPNRSTQINRRDAA